MKEKWIKWTVLEAMTRIISMLLQKIGGTLVVTLAHAFYGTMIIGLVQTIAGLSAAVIYRKIIFVRLQNIIGAVAFGCLAVFAVALGLITYLNGGEVGVVTFIITLSIAPGAILDWVFFRKRMLFRQCLGIGFCVVAGYGILNCPSLQQLIHLALWVRLAFIISLIVCVNQGITKAIRDIDPLIKNFWGGLTGFIISGVGLMIFSFPTVINYHLLARLRMISLALGLIIVASWSFNLLSYKIGANIAIKKLVNNGIYLTGAMIAGVILFGEMITFWKILGIGFYLIAFYLMKD